MYDGAGLRVRKVTERQNGTRKNERTYLGGFEVYREYDGNETSVSLERETLHVMDDKQRIALVETRTQGNDPALPQLIRYQFGNHLGSASVELDDQAQIISYEEFYPYGSTSYQAVPSQTETPKRYRFMGKERDEESGLNYHGARYYALWIGRWVSCDPAGIIDHINLYVFSRANPINFVDRNGRNSEKAEKEAKLIEARQKQSKLLNQLRTATQTKDEQQLAKQSRQDNIKEIKSKLKKDNLETKRLLSANEKEFASQKAALEASLKKNEKELSKIEENLKDTLKRLEQIGTDLKETAKEIKTLESRVRKLGGDPNAAPGDTKYGVADEASHAEAEADDLAGKINALEGETGKVVEETGKVVEETGKVVKEASTLAKFGKGAGAIVKTGGRIALKGAPILGAVVSITEGIEHFREGRYARAIVDFVEAIPILGDVVLAGDLVVSLVPVSAKDAADAAEGAATIIRHGVQGTTSMDDIYQQMCHGTGGKMGCSP